MNKLKWHKQEKYYSCIPVNVEWFGCPKTGCKQWELSLQDARKRFFSDQEDGFGAVLFK